MYIHEQTCAWTDFDDLYFEEFWHNSWADGLSDEACVCALWSA